MNYNRDTILLYHSGELDEAEMQRVELWISHNSEARAYYKELCELDAQLQAELPDIEPPRSYIPEIHAPLVKVIPFPRWITVSAAAACIVLGLLGGYFAGFQAGQDKVATQKVKTTPAPQEDRPSEEYSIRKDPIRDEIRLAQYDAARLRGRL